MYTYARIQNVFNRSSLLCSEFSKSVATYLSRIPDVSVKPPLILMLQNLAVTSNEHFEEEEVIKSRGPQGPFHFSRHLSRLCRVFLDTPVENVETELKGGYIRSF